jgi:hypothetical protein
MRAYLFTMQSRSKSHKQHTGRYRYSIFLSCSSQMDLEVCCRAALGPDRLVAQAHQLACREATKTHYFLACNTVVLKSKHTLLLVTTVDLDTTKHRSVGERLQVGHSPGVPFSSVSNHR